MRFGKIAIPRSYDPKGPTKRHYAVWLERPEINTIATLAGHRGVRMKGGLLGFPPGAPGGSSSVPGMSGSVGSSYGDSSSGQPAGMRTSPSVVGSAARAAATPTGGFTPAGGFAVASRDPGVAGVPGGVLGRGMMTGAPVQVSSTPQTVNRTAKGSMGLPPDGLMPDEAAAIRWSIESSPRAPAVLTSNITAKADLQPQVTSTFPARPEFRGALPAAVAAAINSGRGRRSTLAARTAAFSPPVPAPASTTAGPQFGLARSLARGSPAAPVPGSPPSMPTPSIMSPPVAPVSSNPEIAGILSNDAMAVPRYLDPVRTLQPGRLAWQNQPKDQARIGANLSTFPSRQEYPGMMPTRQPPAPYPIQPETLDMPPAITSPARPEAPDMMGENTAPLTAEQEQRVTDAIFGVVKHPMWQSIGQRNRNVLRGRSAISGMDGSRGGSRERLIAALLNQRNIA